MSSIPIDTRLTISNMTTEWGALSGLFPIDTTLECWLRYKATEAAMFPDHSAKERITHERIDELCASPLDADPDALYAKQLYLNLVVSCTNSRHSDIQATVAVFKEAAKANGGVVPKIVDVVKMFIAAASSREQEAAEDSGDWQVILDAGAEALVMGSREALAYLGSLEVVAAIALKGIISGPGAYKVPENWAGVDHGYGNSFIGNVESTETSSNGPAVEILPGFPESVREEIVFMDIDSQDTDQIYPRSMTYESNVSKEAMANACMKDYDPDFQKVSRPNDILVSGNGFGCGSSPIFSPSNSINHGLMGLELPRLIQGLRAAFPKDTKRPIPTFRTGWTLKWDVKKSIVHVQEGEGGEESAEKVGDIPPNVQEIIALGGLHERCRHELKKAS
ncbi:probable homoaconitase precursor [Fusarium fujikuroi]|nr:putative homoaconitase precursor [Fusarium fujikuroi]SCN63915.1 probable homoaconitase precursor [Fusarium fujikuroi]SCN76916.1 probable homoaconitase precursor [Fusarium fujikuroi]SCN87103.1 probable homoaconitase precursor [Fusarium fujikuroi]SCO31244.1 probable homoaconitase precursor [Fusarium fujikuroi]